MVINNIHLKNKIDMRPGIQLDKFHLGNNIFIKNDTYL